MRGQTRRNGARIVHGDNNLSRLTIAPHALYHCRTSTAQSLLVQCVQTAIFNPVHWT